MIATFWNVLNKYADETKKRFGVDSEKYETVQEIEKLLQFAYDTNNCFDKVEINAKPKNEVEAFLFDKLADVLVFKDKDGYYYEIEGHHMDSASEVLEYIIDDRAHRYKKMRDVYIKRFSKAVDATAEDWQSLMKQSIEINFGNIVRKRSNEK